MLDWEEWRQQRQTQKGKVVCTQAVFHFPMSGEGRTLHLFASVLCVQFCRVLGVTRWCPAQGPGFSWHGNICNGADSCVLCAAGAYAAPSTGSLRRLGMFVQGRALISTLQVSVVDWSAFKGIAMFSWSSHLYCSLPLCIRAQIPGTMRLKGGAKKDKVTDEYEVSIRTADTFAVDVRPSNCASAFPLAATISAATE